MLNDRRSLAAREDHPIPSRGFKRSLEHNARTLHATRSPQRCRAALYRGRYANRSCNVRYVQVPAQRGELAVKCAVLCASCLSPAHPLMLRSSTRARGACCPVSIAPAAPRGSHFSRCAASLPRSCLRGCSTFERWRCSRRCCAERAANRNTAFNQQAWPVLP